MKFCSNILGPQAINPTDFGEHLTFPIVHNCNISTTTRKIPMKLAY